MADRMLRITVDAPYQACLAQSVGDMDDAAIGALVGGMIAGLRAVNPARRVKRIVVEIVAV